MVVICPLVIHSANTKAWRHSHRHSWQTESYLNFGVSCVCL